MANPLPPPPRRRWLTRFPSPPRSLMADDYLWKHEYHPHRDDNFVQRKKFKAQFTQLEVNFEIDLYSKIAGLIAAPSVVCVKCYSDNNEIRCCSGFIMECDKFESDGGYECIIMTSSTLLRKDHNVNSLLDSLKLVVVLSNKKQYQADLLVHDFHYNLAALTIKVDHPLEASKLRYLDDRPASALEFQLHPQTDRLRLVHGIKVLALGRSCCHRSGIMVAPGLYSTERCDSDCKELLMSTNIITKCGIGGPMINLNSEVIGVNFFDIGSTPFLPINTVSRWWSHFKENRVNCRPWIGAEIRNLKTVELHILPNLENGVVVDEITPHSPADSAKILVGDFIVEFDGKAVHSALQFFDLLWDKVDKSAMLVVMRRTTDSPIHLPITVANIRDDQFNHWPLPGGDINMW